MELKTGISRVTVLTEIMRAELEKHQEYNIELEEWEKEQEGKELQDRYWSNRPEKTTSKTYIKKLLSIIRKETIELEKLL